MCTDYDETVRLPRGIVKDYPFGTSRVMVYYRLNPETPGAVELQWYFGGTLAGQQPMTPQVGYNFGWISAQSALPVGDYAAAIALPGPIELRRVQFRVLASP